MNEGRGPVSILRCRACGDPIGLTARPVAASCSQVCADAKRVRKNEQRDSWFCEEYYGGGMTLTEIAEKYRVPVPDVKRIIEGF